MCTGLKVETSKSKDSHHKQPMKLFQIRQMLKLQSINFLAFLPPFLCVSLSPAPISRAFLTVSVWQLLNMNWFLLKPLKFFNMPQRAQCLQFTLKWFMKKRERAHGAKHKQWMNVDHVNTVQVMDTPTRQTKTLEFGAEKGAGVQPQQDPGGTLRMNSIRER